ncbi:hypothetical protein EDD21DRAFT_391215 [Dissophora ornata]|nr:hypothetical protein BGZ58_001598 [Dissophora ornata]KAI8595452.1 hypothetical protein EDD21DRAFT_391215 [Dissophora ornata]
MPSHHHIRTLLKGHGAPEEAPSSKASSTDSTNSNTITHFKDAARTNNTVEAQGGQEGKASDQMLSTPGSRKGSILFNMMLPPEALPVDANLALPPIIALPSMFESNMSVMDRDIPGGSCVIASEITSSTSASTSTAHSLRSWIRSGNSGGGGASSEGHDGGQITKRNNRNGDEQGSTVNKEGIVKGGLSVVSSETTTTTTMVVSKSTQIKTWIISRMGRRSEGSHGNEGGVQHMGSTDDDGKHKMDMSDGMLTSSQESSSTLQVQQQQQSVLLTGTDGQQVVSTTMQKQEIVQEIHQKTRNVALVNVNVSVQDVFGLGKAMEILLAMFHAHGAFLRRQPFWLGCVVMGWEGLMVMLLVWGLLRIVGLAEVIVWGADDLVRGTLLTVNKVGRMVQSCISR